MSLEYRDKGTTGTQLAVVCGSLVIGHVSKAVLSPMVGHSIRWSWSFGFDSAAPPGFQRHGTADTVEDAKAAVERNWAMWLQASGLVEVEHLTDQIARGAGDT